MQNTPTDGIPRQVQCNCPSCGRGFFVERVVRTCEDCRNRSIICWGDPEPQFTRLGVSPVKAYEGHTRFSRLTVWACSEVDFATLAAEPVGEGPDPWTQGGACWRYAEGANISMSDGEVRINGVGAIGGWRIDWERDVEDDPETGEAGEYVPEHPDLLTYFCDEIGASSERNVTALAAEMARANGWTIGELFTRLQPARVK